MPSSGPQRARDVAFRDIDGEMILVSASRACSYSLNEVGSQVWRQADGQRTMEEIADTVAQHFDIPLEQALADVRAFVDEIALEGLLVVDVQQDGKAQR
jgi:hypothetical protein